MNEEKKVMSFKGFNKDMKCRGFQYEIGKEYEIDGDIKACERGFHACEYPLDVFDYYPPGVSRYCQVEQSGKIDDSELDKTCSSKIKIGAELTIPGIVKAAISYVRSRCTNENCAETGEPATAGDYGAATAGFKGAATAGNFGAATAGDSGAATAGDSGAATAGKSGAATAGESGAATAGDSGAATAGDYGAATAGDYGAATAGDYGAATSRGSSAVGKNGLAVARGNNVKVKGGLGAILVIAEENTDDYNINAWKAVVVDGNTIKADTWYRLVDVELKEVDDTDDTDDEQE